MVRTGKTWGRAFSFGLLALIAFAATLTRAGDVPDDAITLKVGQVLYLTFAVDGDNLGAPKTLPQPSTTDPMVTLQLTQEGSTRTLLVTNGYARPLVYRAVARMRGHRRTFDVPSIPVRPGLQSVVTLGEPFDEIQLFEFKLAAAQ
jgi:hypothetical protein